MLDFIANKNIELILNGVADDVSEFPAEFHEIQEKFAEFGNDNVKKLALSFWTIKSHPRNVRGYLWSFDILCFLGFSEFAFDILEVCRKINGQHILFIERVLGKLIGCYDFYGALDFAYENFDLISLELSKNKKINSFVKSAILNVNSLQAAEDFGFDKFQIFSDLILERARFVDGLDFDDQLRCVENLINERDFKEAELFLFLSLNSGNKSVNLFNAAISSFYSDGLSVLRQACFSYVANRTYPESSYFSLKSSYYYCFRGEPFFSKKCIIDSLKRKAVDDGVLHAALRLSCLFDDVELRNLYYIAKDHWSSGRLSRTREESLLALKQSSFERQVGKIVRGRCSHSENIKVALCVSGQLRGSKNSIVENINRIQKKLEADVYVSTWDEQVLSPPKFNRVHRFFGSELTELLPRNLRNHDEFIRKFPSVIRKIGALESAKVDVTWYSKEVRRVKKFHVESSDDFLRSSGVFDGLKLRGTFNQAKMFYKMHAAHSMLDGEYDVVVRMRPDMGINIENISDWVRLAFLEKNQLIVSYLTGDGFGDQFAIGSLNAMNIYSGIWSNVARVGRFRYKNFFDKSCDNAAEQLVAANIIENGMRLHVVKPSHSDFSEPIALADEFSVYDEVVKDSSANDFEYDVSNFIEAYGRFKGVV